jgi:hypothetical protein
MDGSATFTMLTSSSVIKAASWVTANARQRLGSAPSRGGSGTVVWSAGGAVRRKLAAACSGRTGVPTDWMLIFDLH